MTGPDQRVLLALDRQADLDLVTRRRATRLGATRLNVSVRKLVRMRLVAEGHSGSFKLTAKGRQLAKQVRTSQ